MIFIGIDPGLKGAVAWYKCDDAPRLYVVDIPTHKATVNGKPRNRLDITELGALFQVRLAPVKDTLAIIEDVHAMPLQGVASSFTFGFVAGAIQQSVCDAGIRAVLVPPATWKRRLGISADKNEARALATKIFPQYADLWAKVSHADRAEAALLAYYGSKFLR